MALSVIFILYATLGLLAAAGSISLSRKLFPARAEQVFFALLLIPIAAFYLAFTAHFGHAGAWRFETAGVIAFTVLGLLGVRSPAMLITGYLLHGLWDVLHEIHAHAGGDLSGIRQATGIPLAYGALCATYDWCMAAYFYTRRGQWDAALAAHVNSARVADSAGSGAREHGNRTVPPQPQGGL
jgi:hypothetical protein